MNNKKVILTILVALFLCSCGSAQKKPYESQKKLYTEMGEKHLVAETEEVWTIEEATNYFREKIQQNTNNPIIKMFVNTYENDGKYYAFALTGSESMLPYDPYEARNVAQDTDVWFVTKDKIEKVEYHIPSGDIPYDLDTYSLSDDKEFIYLKTWNSDESDNNVFYTVIDGSYVEIQNIVGSLLKKENGELYSHTMYFDSTSETWTKTESVLKFDGEKFSLVTMTVETY